MEYADILPRLVEALTPYAGDRVVVGEDTKLVGDLATGSLKIMNMMLAVEDAFDISIPVNTLADVKTVRDLALEIQQQTRDH